MKKRADALAHATKTPLTSFRFICQTSFWSCETLT